ncbi:hypothetical protein TSAR_015331 [Trichomalopsis sarcophagae]|uniref:Protein kinase domain-containing protein n=1 Tax=Trichomalopsis sarcophagae TaxID=543379 RepID=A0A232EW20_9HYME|nr:hypothetical protein TSAR_015331 [Trichomalopsis sarcophagae]
MYLDLNCQYNVIHWGGEHDLYQYQLDAAREYSLELRHLNYARNNTVYVVSRNELGSRQSENATLTFETPSCLSVHRNLSVCGKYTFIDVSPNTITPAAVTGLHVVAYQSNKNAVDFKVAWEEPELQPDNYTVIVQPLDFENSSVEVTVSGVGQCRGEAFFLLRKCLSYGLLLSAFVINCLQNESTVDVPKVVLSRQYKIAILAESEGGTSLEWKLITATTRLTVESQLIIAISTLTTLVLIVVFGYTYIRYKRMKGHSCQYSFFENINRKACGFEDIKGPLKTLSPYEAEDNNKLRDKFEIQVDRLSIKKMLGSGISGVVKLATLQDDKKKIIQVAVKMLREDASSDDVQNFHREIALMKSAGNHPNIVSIIGCCTLSKQPLLVVEFCSKGDLQTYLRTVTSKSVYLACTTFPAGTLTATWLFSDTRGDDDGSFQKIQRESNNFAFAINNRLYDIQQESGVENKINPEDLLNFARQVASGMEFLSSNRIVHRDLAARNVLVCADQTVKISDFGLSRDIYQENVYKKQTNGKLPIKWMAIEALTHQVYTTHSDVWSFGVLLYEIVTLGGNPYPGLPCCEILHFLKSGYRMERPSNCGFQLLL